MATEKQHAPVRALCRFTLGSQPERHHEEPEELSRRDHELHQLAGLPHPLDHEDHHPDADEEAAGARQGWLRPAVDLPPLPLPLLLTLPG